LGIALGKKGRIEEATREFTEALRTNPGDPDARRELEGLKRRGGGR
jgi:Flp pilus assembly protein TadD